MAVVDCSSIELAGQLRQSGGRADTVRERTELSSVEFVNESDPSPVGLSNQIRRSPRGRLWLFFFRFFTGATEICLGRKATRITSRGIYVGIPLNAYVVFWKERVTFGRENQSSVFIEIPVFSIACLASLNDLSRSWNHPTSISSGLTSLAFSNQELPV